MPISRDGMPERYRGRRERVTQAGESGIHRSLRTVHGHRADPAVAPALRRLADLQTELFALVHRPSYRGDGGAALRSLPDHYEQRLRAALA